MAINSNDILAKVAKSPPEWDALPVEVSWPDQDGTSGETRKVIAVYVENSGDPEVPTLRLICGMSYNPVQPTPEEAQEMLDHWHDAPKAPDWMGTTADGDRVMAADVPLPPMFPRILDDDWRFSYLYDRGTWQLQKHYAGKWHWVYNLRIGHIFENPAEVREELHRVLNKAGVHFDLGADPELEQLLREEEEIEARVRQTDEHAGDLANQYQGPDSDPELEGPAN